MADLATAPGQGTQRLGRVLEYVALGLLLILPIPFYVAHRTHAFVVPIHLGLVLPLFWSRKAPELAFAVIAAVAFIQWLIYDPMPSDVALLIALFVIASTRPVRHTVMAAAVLELGVLLVVLGHGTLGGQTDYQPGPLRAHFFDFIFLSGLTTAAAVLGTNMQTRRAYLHEVEERAARLEAERDQQAQLAVAGERARVAREMHDIVAHNLAVMVALTDGAALTLTTNPQRATIALEEASKAGRTALTDMRQVLGILRDSDAEASREATPHLSALDQLVETVRHTGLDVRYRTSGPIQTLPEALQLSTYRIVQEALTNVMKHAHGARVVTVDVATSEVEVVIVVQDDGTASTAPPGVGHGLVGIRERAALHGGTVSAGATPAGWRTESRLRIEHLDEGGQG
ncbi:MAG: sensor histidine kinase [Marmoricola sp.]